MYPLVGPPVKLPNSEQVYRLYQDATVVVNARVSRASPRIQAEIKALVHETGLQVVTTEAYFFSEFYIGSRHDASDFVHVNLEEKVVSASTSTFRVETPCVDRTPSKYDVFATSHVSIPIHWREGSADGMCLTVSFSRNPQIRNGLRLNGTNLRCGTGLLIRNYRARFFQLPCLDYRAIVELPRHCRRVTTQRGTVGHHEVSLCVSKTRPYIES